MTREEIINEMKEMFGSFPTAWADVPDYHLESVWTLWKGLYSADAKIPNKYKELIGLAVAAATGDDFDILNYTESAKYFGATDAELKETAVVAQLASSWGTFYRALNVDKDQYIKEMKQMFENMKAKETAGTTKSSM